MKHALALTIVLLSSSAVQAQSATPFGIEVETPLSELTLASERLQQSKLVVIVPPTHNPLLDMYFAYLSPEDTVCAVSGSATGELQEHMRIFSMLYSELATINPAISSIELFHVNGYYPGMTDDEMFLSGNSRFEFSITSGVAWPIKQVYGSLAVVGRDNPQVMVSLRYDFNGFDQCGNANEGRRPANSTGL